MARIERQAHELGLARFHQLLAELDQITHQYGKPSAFFSVKSVPKIDNV